MGGISWLLRHARAPVGTSLPSGAAARAAGDTWRRRPVAPSNRRATRPGGMARRCRRWSQS